MEDGNPYFGLVIFVFFLIIDTIMYGFTVALSEVNTAPFEKKAENGDKLAAGILELTDKPEKVRKTMQFVLSASFVVIGCMDVRSISAYFLTMFDFKYTALKFAAWFLIGLAVIIFSLSISVFAAHRFASKNPERWLTSFKGIVSAVVCVCKPAVFVISLISKGIVRIFGLDPDEELDNVTEEEIMSMVNEGHEQGVLLASEAEMITNIFEFGDKEARDIMTHRKNLIAIDGDTCLSDTVHSIINENYSRFPVYDGDIDNIIGIIHFRDVMKANEIPENHGKTLKEIKSILMEPHFIPETRNINILFKSMQSEKVHMEIVVDEYGQTAGIVTQEDILEEIVGNIFDEYDVEEEFIKKVGDNIYIMAGLTELDDIEDELGIEFDEDEFDTLNGFLISRLDRIPQEDDKAVVLYNDYEFRVLEVKNKIIQKVKVSRKLPKEAAL